MYQMNCFAAGFELNVTVRVSPVQYSLSSDSGLGEMFLGVSFTKLMRSYFYRD